ncbi:uncharacterized protein LOC107627306 [Arachis ipaensis]|uniref:uncharacterized protein LOC107610950 n=1 Tax=Arachis ipaensis TaxID=130454 RepID=UPI000A2B6345|nr:uncharacterized protein LOC107610950 [Arachis ipaensis]XP_020969198.1 uncharacterized protein LOC107627306 [Arachis ipaensis]
MEQSQSNSQPQDNAAQNSQTGSSRGKSDPAWQYFTVKYDKNNKAQYTCIFCLNTYNGGGIYSKRRNRLEHQRLSDIVYVTYNLRLQSRMHCKKKNYDPIDIQSIDTVDFWVMPDEDDPEFTNGDIEGIENLIYTDNAMPSYPTDGGDVELDVDFPNVADSSNTVSFGGTSDDGGFGLPVYDGDVGTLNDNYDF